MKERGRREIGKEGRVWRWIPREHGGWAFFAEPVVAALGVYPSGRGVCLGLVALCLFLLREPVRRILRGGGVWGKEREAMGVGLGLAVVASGALFGSGVMGGVFFGRVEEFLWIGLAGMVVFGVSDYWGKSRGWWAEVAGVVVFDSFVPLIFVVGGAEGNVLWVVFFERVTRSVMAVMGVRQILRFQKLRDGEEKERGKRWRFFLGVGISLGIGLLWAGVWLGEGGESAWWLLPVWFLVLRQAGVGWWVFSRFPKKVSAVWVGVGEVIAGVVWIGLFVWVFRG